MKKWYRLDNAAKIYPPVSNAKRGSTFSLSATFTFAVDKDKLEQAAENTLNRFPTFKTTLKRGVFWYYLEENIKPFKVEVEDTNFLKPINFRLDNGYLFRLGYCDKRITITIFHALADGTGGIEFFKTLICEYLRLCGHKVESSTTTKSINAPFTNGEAQDTFSSVYNSKCGKPKKERNSFKTDGTPMSQSGTGIITGTAQIEQLKQVAKKYNTTITGLISGVSLYACYLAFIKDKKVKNKYLTALVPINMRKLYKSETVRNFALFTRVSHDFAEDITLKDLISSSSQQLKDGVNKELLDKVITSNVKSEKNIALKVVPLLLKDLVMRLVYKHVGDNLHTYNLSNLGIVDLPDSATKYLTDFVFALGPSYTSKNHIAVCSLKDNIYITFTRVIVENTFEREFFKILIDEGVNFNISSNYWEATDETL